MPSQREPLPKKRKRKKYMWGNQAPFKENSILKKTIMKRVYKISFLKLDPGVSESIQ